MTIRWTYAFADRPAARLADACAFRTAVTGTRLSASRGEHGDWAVLRSPAGQAFCAVPWHGETVRPPVVSGSRPDQVCLGVPPSR
ncbi:hypothetical protein ACWEOA_30965 [Streptomyces sp. NPDC004457]